MGHNLVSKLDSSNLHRTHYLLNHYNEFLAQKPYELDLKTSRSVMSILAFSLRDIECFTNADCDLMNCCGPLLPPAIQNASEVIRGFPIEVSSKVYPVLYHCYLTDCGTAISIEQLAQRLENDNLFLPSQDLHTLLTAGETMMATLLFENKFTSAMHASGLSFYSTSV